MAIKYTSKDSTRFVLTTDCYLPKFGGYLKRGDIITVPEGTPMSQTWTEIDDEGNPVPGGQVGRKIHRTVASKPAALKDKTLEEIAELGEDVEEQVPEEEQEAAPTPPAAAKPSKPARAAAAAKPSKRS